MSFQISRESYLHRLERRRLEQLNEKQRQPSSLSLEDKIRNWWETVPEEEKRMNYRMDFFVNRFGAIRQKLGLALYSLGWQRKRRWTPGKPFSRFWVKIDKQESFTSSSF